MLQNCTDLALVSAQTKWCVAVDCEGFVIVKQHSPVEKRGYYTISDASVDAVIVF